MKAVYPDYKDERVTAGAEGARGGLVQHAQRRRHAVPDSRARRRARSGRGAKDRATPPCRSAACAATCRCASRRRARCRATASSASCSRARGITIYPIQSPSLTAFDDQPERWIDVRWDIDERQQGALSGARLGDRHQRAGLARRDRPGRSPPTTPTSIRCRWCAPRPTSPRC